MSRAHRNTLFVEDATVLSQASYPGEQYVLRLAAPRCAARATAGSFVHLRCSAALPMRRPLSIMRADAGAGWIEVLYKVVGEGLAGLSRAAPGDRISCLGPIGRGFRPDTSRRRPVLIGGGVGIPPLVFLAEQLAADAATPWQPVGFFGSELPFPFAIEVADTPLPGVPGEVNRCIADLARAGLPHRLASWSGYEGCFNGYVTELARGWLAALPAEQRAECEIFSCGPEPMLRAAQRLADEFDLPSQLCLEEFMACAVGGCAGCTVLLATGDGPAMKRVCVDGPVFDGREVYPA